MSRRAAVGLLSCIAASGSLFAIPGLAVGQEGGRVAVSSDTTYGCIICHADKRRTFTQGVHSERGIQCDDCHGGDPRSFEIAEAHVGDFVGSPGKIGTVEVCGSCHSSVDLMRQYGISADQVAELRSSRHGQLLLGEGNLDAPTCTDCHDAHTILRPDDARSNTYPTAIPATCGRCHEDAGLMATYGLPTSQFEEYRSSAHGHALFEEENFSAPSCIGCHGSHAALPPAVREISNVCGQCHVLVRDALAEGVHGALATGGAAPSCTGCHANHSTEPVPIDGIAETCTACHEAGGQPAQMGAELQDRVVRATLEIDEAEGALEELGGAGYRTEDLRFRLQAARTSYERISLVQHSLDLEALEDLSLRVATVSRDIRAAAEVAAEHRWEHRLFLIPVWFLALSAIALGIFKMREAEQEND